RDLPSIQRLTIFQYGLLTGVELFSAPSAVESRICIRNFRISRQVKNLFRISRQLPMPLTIGPRMAASSFINRLAKPLVYGSFLSWATKNHLAFFRQHKHLWARRKFLLTDAGSHTYRTNQENSKSTLTAFQNLRVSSRYPPRVGPNRVGEATEKNSITFP